jgi:hypothetical protein
MIIAKKKKAENIAEYILYMWQLEDLLRAFKFDIDAVAKYLLVGVTVNDYELDEAKKWYADLAEMMQTEEITEKGHLLFVINTLNDLNDFHLALLEKVKDPQYTLLFQAAWPNIEEFRQKKASSDDNDVTTCLNGLYGLLLMRLQKREISESTLLALKTFSNLLAGLSQKFLAFENGDLNIYTD